MAMNVSLNLTVEVSYGIISNTTTQRFLSFLDCCLLPLLIISGFTMNTLSFFVLHLQNFKNRARIVLLGLTISDNVFLLFTLLRKVSCIVSKIDEISGSNFKTLLTPQVYVIGVTFARITSILTVLISTERLAVVLWPLQTRMTLTFKRIKITVTTIFIVTLVCFLPLYFVYETKSNTDAIMNRSVLSLKMTGFYRKNKTVVDAYTSLVLNVLFRFLPCVIVAGSTGMLVIYLKRHIKWRIRTTNISKADLILEERRVTKTLIVISIMYVVCLLPGTLFTLARHIYSEFNWNGKYHNLFLVLSGVNSVLECSNSSFNFVIYMITNRTFYTKFQSLRKRRDCSRKRDDADYGSHETCL